MPRARSDFEPKPAVFKPRAPHKFKICIACGEAGADSRTGLLCIYCIKKFKKGLLTDTDERVLDFLNAQKAWSDNRSSLRSDTYTLAFERTKKIVIEMQEHLTKAELAERKENK